MEIEKFEMAIAINEELDMLRKHKEDLKKITDSIRSRSYIQL